MSPFNLARLPSLLLNGEGELPPAGLLTGPQRVYPKGHYLRHEGEPQPELYRLQSGWLCSSITTAEGDRQITRVYLPGDLVGLPSMACDVAVESILAQTDAVVDVVPLSAFAAVFRDHPRFAALLFMLAQEERVALMHQLALVGRVRGGRRMAAFLLSICRRVRQSDPLVGDSFVMPLTQQDLGDATGMSIVHANRSLKVLRDRGLATFQKGVLTIHDYEGLTKFSAVPAGPIRSGAWI